MSFWFCVKKQGSHQASRSAHQIRKIPPPPSSGDSRTGDTAFWLILLQVSRNVGSSNELVNQIQLLCLKGLARDIALCQYGAVFHTQPSSSHCTWDAAAHASSALFTRPGIRTAVPRLQTTTHYHSHHLGWCFFFCLTLAPSKKQNCGARRLFPSKYK